MLEPAYGSFPVETGRPRRAIVTAWLFYDRTLVNAVDTFRASRPLHLLCTRVCKTIGANSTPSSSIEFENGFRQRFPESDTDFECVLQGFFAVGRERKVEFWSTAAI